MKFTPKIIFFDIDETLYIKAQQRIPNSIFEQVLPRLKAKGIIPAIATGRCFGTFPDALKPWLGKDGFEVLVTINGQHNRYQDQLISHYPISSIRIQQAIDKLNELKIPYGLVGNDEVVRSCENAFIDKALKPITEHSRLDTQLHLTQPIYQMLAFFTSEKESEVIASGVLQDDFKIVRWHDNAVDFFHKKHSKAMGIQDVLNYFGFAMNEVMAFGDGLNDIEMLASVGFGVAMGNGEAELKAVADYVTLPIEQDGILYALEQLSVI